MRRDYIKWWSPSLGRDMEMLVFGHGGTPVLVFPSSMGRFYEWEDFKMVDTLHDKLEHGHNMYFCVDSVDSESFYNKGVSPYVRIQRQNQYEAYIMHEVLPFIHNQSGNHFVISAGCSFGAYHALNFAFKHPYKFGKLIAMSGAFNIKSFMHGFYDDNVYFQNPVDYLPNMSDHHQLEGMRRMDIRLVAGDHDICLQDNREMSDILHSKSVGHNLDVWGHGTVHDWPSWREMIKAHIA